MWIFTRQGFFSAVCTRQGDGGHREPVDIDRIIVRARLRSHLQALITHFPTELGVTEILESAG